MRLHTIDHGGGCERNGRVLIGGGEAPFKGASPPANLTPPFRSQPPPLAIDREQFVLTAFWLLENPCPPRAAHPFTSEH